MTLNVGFGLYDTDSGALTTKSLAGKFILVNQLRIIEVMLNDIWV